MAREGLVLYHNLNKLDRWGGSGFGLSTLVKLAGWAGLIAVMAALVVKLRSVEQQLDPVSHSVDELRAELDAAKQDVKKEANLGKQELAHVHDEAVALRDAVRASTEAHAKDGSAVRDADQRAKELSEHLKSDLERAKAVSTQQEAVANDLGTYQQTVASAKSGLDTSSAQVAGSLTDLGNDLQSVRTRAQGLDKDLAALGVQPVRDDLARIDAEAKSLADALHAAVQDSHDLDQTLKARLDEERQLREAEQAERARLKAQAQAQTASASAKPTKGEPVISATVPQQP